jgi:hypothetical protein
MPAGQQQAVEGGRVQPGPGRRGGELRGPGELGVEDPGLGRGTELPEDHAGEQPGVSGRERAGLLGGEDHLMPGITQDPPRHRDLSDVEVPIGKRDQHAHPAIIAAPATGGTTVKNASDLDHPHGLADATERSFRRGTEGRITHRDQRHIEAGIAVGNPVALHGRPANTGRLSPPGRMAQRVLVTARSAGGQGQAGASHRGRR